MEEIAGVFCTESALVASSRCTPTLARSALIALAIIPSPMALNRLIDEAASLAHPAAFSRAERVTAAFVAGPPAAIT